jgi:hypothetical protein
MTPQEHNKTLGICHLVYGGLHTLLTFVMLLFFFFFFAAVSQTAPKDGGPPPEFFLPFGAAFLGFIFVITLLFTLPAFVAGYALLKRKSWARMASLVAAVFEAMNVPIGTAVCIYSFWFMLSEPGKQLYDRAAQMGVRPSLHDAPPPAWWREASAAAQRERESTQPPADWRKQ